jgi:hypothetical protein
MKKTIAFMLAAAILLSVTGCRMPHSEVVPTDSQPMKVEMGQTESDYEGVEVQIADATWGEDGLVLKVDWINRTPHEALFGASYSIERKEGDRWVNCQAVDELVFIAIAYILPAGDTRTETYQVSALFDVSEAGTYRFRSEISVNDGTENANKCSVSAEFSLEPNQDKNQTQTIVFGEEHTHQTASEPQTVADPISGYCGNTQTTVYIDGEAYTFMYDHSVTLTDILINLAYDPNKICRCRPEYTVDTEFGKGYGINLTAGYARCEKGQADLTKEQIDQIRTIIEWIKTEKPGR